MNISNYLRWSVIFLLGINFLTSCNLPSNPVITDQAVEPQCGARITYIDHSPDPSIVFLQRSSDGTHFYDIKIADNHGNQTSIFIDEGILPKGTYYYVVGYFNPNEVRYSEPSGPVVIDDDSCGTEPIVFKPYNPIITYLAVQAKCDVTMSIVNYADDADGIRIYRRSTTQNEKVIADLTQQDLYNSGGYFYDLGLPPDIYQYRASTYNENGEAFSDLSEEVVIADDCPLTYAPIETPLVVPNNTLAIFTNNPSLPSTATSTSEPKFCIWEASINVFLRKGPNVELFDKAVAIEMGTELPVVGQSENGLFWVLEFQLGKQAYVSKSENVGKTTGDCSAIATLTDPEPPLLEPVATQVESPDDNDEDTTVPECSDGIDNDGDGAIDMRDLRGCESSSDPVEN